MAVYRGEILADVDAGLNLRVGQSLLSGGGRTLLHGEQFIDDGGGAVDYEGSDDGRFGRDIVERAHGRWRR